jgi:Flp pilus assembly protein TadG
MSRHCGAARTRRWRLFLRRCDGQSSVELLGAIPLLLIVVLAAAELLAAGAARVSSSSAADAAAMALLQGGDPSAAARSAASGWAHSRITVRVSGRHARVRLRPPSLVPGLSGLLSTVAEADAGPAPQAGSSS